MNEQITGVNCNSSMMNATSGMQEALCPAYKQARYAEYANGHDSRDLTQSVVGGALGQEAGQQQQQERGEEVDDFLRRHLQELEERRKSLGDTHLSVADTLNLIALHCHHVANDQAHALEYHREALRVLRRAALAAGRGAGKDPASAQNEIRINIAVTLTDIGNVLKVRNETVEAMGAYNESLDMFRSLGMNDSHPRVSATLRCVNRIDLRWQGETAPSPALLPSGASSR